MRRRSLTHSLSFPLCLSLAHSSSLSVSLSFPLCLCHTLSPSLALFQVSPFPNPPSLPPSLSLSLLLSQVAGENRKLLLRLREVESAGAAAERNASVQCLALAVGEEEMEALRENVTKVSGENSRLLAKVSALHNVSAALAVAERDINTMP